MSHANHYIEIGGGIIGGAGGAGSSAASGASSGAMSGASAASTGASGAASAASTGATGVGGAASSGASSAVSNPRSTTLSEPKMMNVLLTFSALGFACFFFRCQRNLCLFVGRCQRPHHRGSRSYGHGRHGRPCSLSGVLQKECQQQRGCSDGLCVHEKRLSMIQNLPNSGYDWIRDDTTPALKPSTGALNFGWRTLYVVMFTAVRMKLLISTTVFFSQRCVSDSLTYYVLPRRFVLSSHWQKP